MVTLKVPELLVMCLWHDLVIVFKSHNNFTSFAFEERVHVLKGILVTFNISAYSLRNIIPPGHTHTHTHTHTQTNNPLQILSFSLTHSPSCPPSMWSLHLPLATSVCALHREPLPPSPSQCHTPRRVWLRCTGWKCQALSRASQCHP